MQISRQTYLLKPLKKLTVLKTKNHKFSLTWKPTAIWTIGLKKKINVRWAWAAHPPPQVDEGWKSSFLFLVGAVRRTSWNRKKKYLCVVSMWIQEAFKDPDPNSDISWFWIRIKVAEKDPKYRYMDFSALDTLP